MKRTEKLSPIVVVIALALFMGVAPPVASLVMGRVGSPLALDILVRGEPQRAVQSDGGGLMLWTTDAGVAQAAITGGGAHLVTCVGTACNLCTYGANNPLGTSQDGGCSATMSDPSYGEPIASGASRIIVTQDTTTHLLARPTSGATCTCPVFQLR